MLSVKVALPTLAGLISKEQTIPVLVVRLDLASLEAVAVGVDLQAGIRETIAGWRAAGLSIKAGPLLLILAVTEAPTEMIIATRQ